MSKLLNFLFFNFLKYEGDKPEATVLSPLLFQQGWNITVDLVIGPKGIRQLTSQDAKVERDWGQIAPTPRLSSLPLSAASYLVLITSRSCPLLKAERPLV